jgi:hypothetical protein
VSALTNPRITETRALASLFLALRDVTHNTYDVPLDILLAIGEYQKNTTVKKWLTLKLKALKHSVIGLL